MTTNVFPSLTNSIAIRPDHTIAASGTALTDNKAILLGLIDDLTLSTNHVDTSNASTTPSSLVTVVSSSDGTTAGAGNRLTDASKLVWGSGAHSWILFQMGAGGAQFCIDLNLASTNGNSLSFFFSPVGDMTGGSTTARPTGSGTLILSGATWGGAVSSSVNTRSHLWRRTDGKGILWVVGNAGNAITYMHIEEASVAHDAVTYKTVGCFLGNTGGSHVVTEANLSSAAGYHGWQSAALTYAVDTPYVRGASKRAARTMANALATGWEFIKSGNLDSATVSNEGTHLHFQDFYWAPAGLSSPSSAPSSGTLHQWVVLGQRWMPWAAGRAFSLTG